MIWVGMSSKGEPALKGAATRDRARIVLGIPYKD
jgi:hypothetical protein